MNRTTIARPSKPAARLSFTDSAPTVALTWVTSSATRSTGSEPELIPVARSLAVVWVKEPEIVALPRAISESVMGSVRNLPQTVDSVWADRQPGSYGPLILPAYEGSSQLSMSFWVRSSQMARCRPGQLAVRVVFGSPGQAATSSRVTLSHFVAPDHVKATLTTQLTPAVSIAALALDMSSPVSPASTGLY